MVDVFILSFFIYSVLGYISEVIYCSIPQRRFVNRGFLYGPYLPIYGFGSLIVTVLLDPLGEYPVAVFVLAFILTSCLEYFTSWLLEKLFSVKLWDYSKHKVNINGRVCLLNSTLFGIMGLCCEYLVQPFVDELIALIPDDICHIIAMAIVALVASDTAISVAKMKAFKDTLARIRALRSEAEEHLAALRGEGKAELAEELRLRFEASIEKYKDGIRKTSEHIMRSNPSLSSRNKALEAQLSILRSWSQERKALKKKYKEDVDAVNKSHIEAMRKSGK
ncbi:MAG: hypothetical protein IAA97_06815 [Spirochaetes bacterium]|uniref:ABC transporter permease n=1 Tax=Candidatus Ornithospirochaeta stercoripullorum TaxID=2840899 RepID=A0A9D9H6I3_9SPIO|nr:hypothetical protein [Candidatus Ornithospirochaeta stercoripullorum]